MSHLYGCRSIKCTSADWAEFVNAMLMSRNDAGSHVVLSAGEAYLAGSVQQGEDFSYTLTTDAAGIEVIRKLAVLMHYPVDTSGLPGAPVATQPAPAANAGLCEWLNFNAGKTGVQL